MLLLGKFLTSLHCAQQGRIKEESVMKLCMHYTPHTTAHLRNHISTCCVQTYLIKLPWIICWKWQITKYWTLTQAHLEKYIPLWKYHGIRKFKVNKTPKMRLWTQHLTGQVGTHSYYWYLLQFLKSLFHHVLNPVSSAFPFQLPILLSPPRHRDKHIQTPVTSSWICVLLFLSICF